MKKENYVSASLEIVCFEASDIVTSSTGFDGEVDEFWC